MQITKKPVVRGQLSKSKKGKKKPGPTWASLRAECDARRLAAAAKAVREELEEDIPVEDKEGSENPSPKKVEECPSRRKSLNPQKKSPPLRVETSDRGEDETENLAKSPPQQKASGKNTRKI